jgi:hypothetical protein
VYSSLTRELPSDRIIGEPDSDYCSFMQVSALLIFISLFGLAHSGSPAGPFAQTAKPDESKQTAAQAPLQETRAEAGATSTSKLALPFKRSSARGSTSPKML